MEGRVINKQTLRLRDRYRETYTIRLRESETDRKKERKTAGVRGNQLITIFTIPVDFLFALFRLE
jgi:hypothetical protein